MDERQESIRREPRAGVEEAEAGRECEAEYRREAGRTRGDRERKEEARQEGPGAPEMIEEARER